MTADQKIARRKLSLLDLASEISNVSRACTVMGYSRQQFYEIRRNFHDEEKTHVAAADVRAKSAQRAIAVELLNRLIRCDVPAADIRPIQTPNVIKLVISRLSSC